MNDRPAPRGVILMRALRLRCPRCSRDKLFRGWFRMHERCSHCGLRYDKEPGYFLGSIYVNYGLTAALVTISYFAFFFLTDVDSEIVLWGLMSFCVLFPLWFFRYARALWLAVDECFDRSRQNPRGDSPTRRKDVA